MSRNGPAQCAHEEIAKLANGVERQGMTIVPLRIYFNEKGRAKIAIALARGKHMTSARRKLRDWGREEGEEVMRGVTRIPSWRFWETVAAHERAAVSITCPHR